MIVRVPLTPPDPTYEVQLLMSRADAVGLFHDINRILTMIDDNVGLVGDGGLLDQDTYDRTNAFLAQLQRDLGIDHEEEAK